MLTIDINGKKYNVSEGYNFSRSAWVETLEEDTKKLILDYTIMWNMVEHQVYNDSFNKNEKTDDCINKLLVREDINEKVDYIWNLFSEYNSKYNSVEEFYVSFSFQNSRINFDEINMLYNSVSIVDKIRLLIYSCYRVRCNLFHGPKNICYLDEQKLLFLSMNEMLSLISKTYGM